MTSIYCNRCGAMNPSEAGFCSKCGYALAAATARLSGSTQGKPALSEAPKALASTRRRPLLIVGLAALAAILVGGVVGAVLFVKPKFAQSANAIGAAPGVPPRVVTPQLVPDIAPRVSEPQIAVGGPRSGTKPQGPGPQVPAAVGTVPQAQEAEPIAAVAPEVPSVNRSTSSFACGATRCQKGQGCCVDEGRCIAAPEGPDCFRECDPTTNEPCEGSRLCKVVQWSPSLHGFQCEE